MQQPVDPLRPPEKSEVARLLPQVWVALATFAEQIAGQEYLLAAQSVQEIRRQIIEMMLAMNGIAWPDGTQNLNRYLGESQRRALEKTLMNTNLDLAERWIGEAVSLIVIYRWYAPQIVEAFELSYPHDEEQQSWRRLCELLPQWPREITTD